MKKQFIKNLSTNSPRGLEIVTNEYLNDGWKIVGGVQANGDQYVQTIKKTTSHDKHKPFHPNSGDSFTVYHSLNSNICVSPPTDKDSFIYSGEPSLTGIEIVVYSALYSCMSDNGVYGRPFIVSVEWHQFTKLTDREIHSVLVSLEQKGYIEIHASRKNGDYEIAIHHRIYRDEFNNFPVCKYTLYSCNSISDLLVERYIDADFVNYGCLDYQKYKNSGLKDSYFLDAYLKDLDIQKYIILGRPYYLKQDTVDALELTDYTEKYYDRIDWYVNDKKCTDVQYISYAAGMSDDSLYQILNKMGLMYPCKR